MDKLEQLVAERKHVGARSVKGPRTSIMDAAGCRGGKSTGARTPERLQRISEANFKHGSYTKHKLTPQRKRGEVGRKVNAELKLIEQRLIEAFLLYY